MAVSGSCLCGAVAFEISGALREVVACHCRQCRKTSGHFVAATACATADLTLKSGKTLRWYRSSENAERGFCNRCGGNLFYRPVGGETTSVMAGTLDPPTGLSITHHIFCAEKSDYYEIGKGLEQRLER